MIYKLVVLSDIHHDFGRLQSLVPLINSSDYLIFCGDGISDIMAMRGELTVPIVCVRGNNDFGTTISPNASFVLGETRVFVTHGHLQNVRQGIGTLHQIARQKQCRLVFFGHTHRFTDCEIDGIHYINPGALCEGSYAAVVGDGQKFSCLQNFM